LEFSDAIYHLTARGNARQKIFFSDADRQLFIDTLAGVVFRYGWICHAYCLMANHYHLLVETPKPNLSLGMRQLNGIYTQVRFPDQSSHRIRSKKATQSGAIRPAFRSKTATVLLWG